MVLKIVGAVLTISSMSAIGFYFSILLRTRLEELKELKKYIFILKGDIRYGGTPLPEAINNMAERTTGSFNHFFLKTGKSLEQMEGNSFKDIWKKGIEEELKDTCLTKQDKLSLERLGDNLGYLDKDMQMNTIELYLFQLETQLEELNAVVKERTRIYNLLGIMAGIFITIVII